MIERPFLFMSGEYQVSMPVVFSRHLWQHTMTPDYLVIENNNLRRSKYFKERLKGIIHFANVNNKDIETSNLKLISGYNIPCWPNPDNLINMLDRHHTLKSCINAGFVSHEVIQMTRLDFEYSPDSIRYPYVIKTGQSHRGIDKYLIHSFSDLEKIQWEGIATIEPFFEGVSVRVLVIGDKEFGIIMENDSSWIKNSPGAEVSTFTVDGTLRSHARAVTEYFGLDIAGVDYIVSPDDKNYHFLEINQYPGINVSDEVAEEAKNFLNCKMDFIENLI